jgi:hypothetical protein
VYIGSDMTYVDQVESRVSEEGLSEWCTTYVAPPGRWPTEVIARTHVLVVDTGTLEPLSPRERRDVLLTLQDHTEPGGAHLLLPSNRSLAPAAFVSFYSGWHREPAPGEKRRQAKSAGLLVSKPAEPESLRVATRQSRGATA